MKKNAINSTLISQEAINSDDLMKGIHWVLCEADRATLAAQSVKKVASSYSQTSVALRYIEVYNEAMAYKNYRL